MSNIFSPKYPQKESEVPNNVCMGRKSTLQIGGWRGKNPARNWQNISMIIIYQGYMGLWTETETGM